MLQKKMKKEKRKRMEKKNAKLEKIEKCKKYSNGECVVIFRDKINDFRPEDAKLGLKILNYGTIVVQDNMLQEDGNRETILVVKFTPFENMTLNEYSKFQKLIRKLALVKHHVNEVSTNGAHKDCAGKMYAVGWRKSEFEKMLYFSKYAPSTWLQRQEDGISVWVKEQETIGWMADFYEERFLKLSSCLFEQVAMEANIAQIPSFGALEYNEVNKSMFASNLTFTLDDFHNVFHCDKDYNSYSYGIWIPTFLESGDLASQEIDKFECKGGEFVIAPYGICIDFNGCDGVTELIWRAKSDEHRTFPSKTKAPFTRIGTSVQISRKLLLGVQAYNRDIDEGNIISHSIRGTSMMALEKTK
jgi:hypothetical protein